MFNMEDIYARLQAGEKIDDIGNEIAAMMNGAVAKFEAEKAAEAAAKAEAEEAKRDLMEEMIEIIQEYAILEGMDPADVEIDEEDIDKMVEAFSAMFAVMRDVKRMAAAAARSNGATPVFAAPVAKVSKINADPNAKTDEQILADFIKMFE